MARVGSEWWPVGPHGRKVNINSGALSRSCYLFIAVSIAWSVALVRVTRSYGWRKTPIALTYPRSVFVGRRIRERWRIYAGDT